MQAFLIAAALIVAFLVGFCAVMFGWIAAMDLFAIKDTTAGMTMFFGAIVAPAVGVLLAVVTGKWLAPRRRARRGE